MIEEAFEVCVFPVKLFCDNKAVVDTLKSGKPGEMTKYMATKYFKLVEWVERGLMEIERIPSAENPADGQTKVDTKFTSFRDMVVQPRESVETSVEREAQVEAKSMVREAQEQAKVKAKREAKEEATSSR